MAGQAWLEASLQRSAKLGREVLQRASKHSVDWSAVAASHVPTTTHENTHIRPERYTCDPEISDAFANMINIMAQATDQCKSFYASGCRTSEPTNMEMKHMYRFHSLPATVMTRPSLPTKKDAPVLEREEDFDLEVLPGTYNITANVPDSQQQTQVVSVRAGESVNITFDF